jgi:sugar phosphate isomerase/epimerase
MPRGAKTPRIHGDSSQAPRLRVAHTWWSLIGLPRGGPEWSMEEKFARVKAAGFEGIEIWVEEKDETRYRKLLDQTGLYLGIGGHPNTIEDFRRLIAQGKRLRAEYLIVHVAHAFMGNEAVAKLVRTGYRIAAGEGLPMMLETHRATVTENLYRTYELLERVPEVRLTGDFSHYVLGGDMGDLPVAERIERLRPLFARVDSMHARVSNGQQVQVDVGAGNGPLAQTWVEIWAETLRHWRKRAQAGDWFPFASELGPPPYAILDLQGGELSDRWEQSLVMKSLIELAWVKSQA